jgi:hypothetical protein
MWLTCATLQHTPVTAIVSVARAVGLSHLYVEVAASHRSF